MSACQICEHKKVDDLQELPAAVDGYTKRCYDREACKQRVLTKKAAAVQQYYNTVKRHR